MKPSPPRSSPAGERSRTSSYYGKPWPELTKESDPRDEFCLIGFRDRPEPPLGFTDAAEIESRLVSVEPRGNTALLDAVGQVVRASQGKANPQVVQKLVAERLG